MSFSSIPLMRARWDCHGSETMAVPFINFTAVQRRYTSRWNTWTPFKCYVTEVFPILLSTYKSDIKINQIITIN
jgi:hypothetical protein